MYEFSDQNWACDADKTAWLIKAKTEFTGALHECGKQLEADIIRFARVDQIPNSIQY